MEMDWVDLSISGVRIGGMSDTYYMPSWAWQRTYPNDYIENYARYLPGEFVEVWLAEWAVAAAVAVQGSPLTPSAIMTTVLRLYCAK
jgi:hypothetical protein